MAPSPTEIYTLSLHDALPISSDHARGGMVGRQLPSRGRTAARDPRRPADRVLPRDRSEEHTSELQSRGQLVCRLLLEKKKQELDAVVPLDLVTLDATPQAILE